MTAHHAALAASIAVGVAGQLLLKAGDVAVALLGALLWSEPLDARQIGALGLIVAGVALLHRG